MIPAVTEGWSKTDASSILKAREHGAIASLARILGDAPEGLARAAELLRRAADAATGEGRPIFSGLRSLGWPGDPIGDFWRAADLVRTQAAAQAASAVVPGQAQAAPALIAVGQASSDPPVAMLDGSERAIIEMSGWA